MRFNSKIEIKGFKLDWEQNPYLKRESGETSGIGTECPVLGCPLRFCLSFHDHN